MDKIFKLINIINKLNLLTSKTKDDKEFNCLVKEGYEELLILKNDNNNEYDLWKNTFLIAADDAPDIYTTRKKHKLKIMENSKFVDKYISQYQIVINKEIYILSPIQYDIYKNISTTKKNWIFSLPTSSGKSHVIRLLALQRHYEEKRTIIITPTLALLNEYHQEFINKNVHSTTYCWNNNYIYILTQERAINFVFNKSDLLLVDESYLLGNMDSRAGILYHVIHNAFSLNINVILFMPNIKDPKIAINKKSFTEHFEDFTNFRSLSTRKWNIKQENRQNWFNNNYTKNESTAIFDTKGRIKNWIFRFTSKLPKKTFSNRYEKLIEFLEIEFGKQFTPLKALKHGLVVNHGSIPKLFRYFSILFFKAGELNWVVCNSTLTKGVNLKLKNIYIFSTDFYEGKRIDNFELRNALGRSGRYSTDINMRIGNVEFIGVNQVYKRFLENINNFTSIAVDRDTSNSMQKNKYVDNYKFERNNNIDWIKTKFGMTKDELKKWVLQNTKKLTNYIQAKYDTDRKLKSEDSKKIWDIFVSNISIRTKILEIGLQIIRSYNKNTENISNSQEKYIFDTLKFQGFNESTKSKKTFIQSSLSELKYLIVKDSLWTNGLIIVNNNNRNLWKINKSILDDKNIDNKNKLLDYLIYRKSEINSKFIEAFLTPLDIYISEILSIKMNHNEIENLLEKNNFPSYIKNYVISRVQNTNNDLIEEIKKVLKNDEHIINIKYIIKKIN